MYEKGTKTRNEFTQLKNQVENTMNYKLLSTTICLVLGTVLAVSSSAQAASFKTNVEYDKPNASDEDKPDASEEDKAKGNIWLKSIEQNNRTVKNFSYVNKTVILFNDDIKKNENNSGAASTDRGDSAITPDKIAESENPRADEITAYLNTRNLNNILDSEDKGTFEINLFFDSVLKEDNSGLDSIFFWERGMNSDLFVQGIDAKGNVINPNIKYKITETRQGVNNAGYMIDTKEIDHAQNVGSWGLSLKDLGVTSLSGIRVSALGETFNGPDFKVVARSVPEPANVMGLGVIATLAVLRRRQSKQTYSLKSD